jgi:hypothetical protein
VNGIIDHLHHSELPVITVLSLISTLYKSLQHLLSLFPAFTKCFLAMVFSSVVSTASCSHAYLSELPIQNLINYSTIFLSLPCRAQLNCQTSTKLVRVRVSLRLEVYYQSVHLSAKPLVTHNQYIYIYIYTYLFTELSPS